MKINITIGTLNVRLGDDTIGLDDLGALGQFLSATVSVGPGPADVPDPEAHGFTEAGDPSEPQPLAELDPQPQAESAVTPSLDVDETDAPPCALSQATDGWSDKDDTELNVAAFGSEGKNKAKLAWALRAQYDSDNGDIVGGGGDYRIVLSTDPAATAYGNLYRERDGYAKLGSVLHSTERRARQMASHSNFIDVVGLVRIA